MKAPRAPSAGRRCVTRRLHGHRQEAERSGGGCPLRDRAGFESGHPVCGRRPRVEPRLPDVGDNDPLSDPLAEANGRRIPHLDLDGVGDLPPPERRSRREGGLLPPDRSLVANDDRQNIGILQQTLRVRPSRKPYVLAGIASFLWLNGLIALAWNQSGGDLKAFVRA